MWAVLTGGLAGAVVTTFIQWWMRTAAEDKQRSAAKQAIQAEIEHAADCARGYLKPKAVSSPGWRVSTALYAHCIPTLLSLGVVNRESAKVLLDYYNQVEAFNRSLDAIADHHGAISASNEVWRARLKALLLVPAKTLNAFAETPDFPDMLKSEIGAKLLKHQGGTHYDRAMRVLGLM